MTSHFDQFSWQKLKNCRIEINSQVLFFHLSLLSSIKQLFLAKSHLVICLQDLVLLYRWIDRPRTPQEESLDRQTNISIKILNKWKVTTVQENSMHSRIHIYFDL